jgi:tRNA threonylcarbamoyladenosine biosynthesis protein TsaB
MTDTPPITLAIETSNPPPPGGDGGASGVAVVRGAEAASSETLARAELEKRASHDDALVSAIERCVSGAGIGIADVSRIAVSVGPGGYTSLRIAVTVAKSLSMVTGAPCVPVDTASGVALSAAETLGTHGRWLVCLAWKRADAWAQPFDGLAPAGEGRIMTMNEIASSGCEAIIADAPVVEAVRGIEPSFAARHITPVFDPVAIARVSLAREAVGPHALTPMYPREPEAVRVWNRKAKA